MCSPTIRITMSVALPGPYGTTTLTGFEGYLSCAGAWAAPMATMSANAEAIIKRRMRSSRALLGHLDLHLGYGLAPSRELVVEPGLRLLERRARLDGDQLLFEAVLQLRSLRSLAN